MIAHLKGRIIGTDVKSIILDVNGVGYKIFTNHQNLTQNTEVSLFTHLAVKENALDLYGFTSKEELDFFELLITVSGIGPKSAIGILSIASVKNLKNGIISGDISHLTKVSGIGKKNAEKIVMELKDKLDDSDHDTSTSGDVDALEALQALGYGERESREALKKVSDIKDAGEKVKKALKVLS